MASYSARSTSSVVLNVLCSPTMKDLALATLAASVSRTAIVPTTLRTIVSSILIITQYLLTNTSSEPSLGGCATQRNAFQMLRTPLVLRRLPHFPCGPPREDRPEKQ